MDDEKVQQVIRDHDTMHLHWRREREACEASEAE